METIKESKEFLKSNYSKGCKCPSCGQMVKLYKRKLNSSNAICMIEFAKMATVGKWYHISDLIKYNTLLATRLNGGEFARMRYFGLIEEMEKDPKETSKRTSGYWRITQKGVDFVNNIITVPKYVFIFDNRVQGLSDEKTNIIESLGNKFNYQELMN